MLGWTYVSVRLSHPAQGMAILLISTELEEILTLSDRIVVLYEGQVMGECNAADADVETLKRQAAAARAR